MKTRLNNKKIEYILFHLDQHIEISNLKEYFWFEQGGIEPNIPFIKFPLSDFHIDKSFRIDNIPVLFPMSKENIFFRFDKDGNLHFLHDLIKSSFYLLAGVQETEYFRADQYDRFTYQTSIQKELSIADWPIVNAYFDLLIKGLEVFANRHKLSFKRKSYWQDKSFGFFLTHDVDRVDKWTFPEVKKRIKTLLQSRLTKYWLSAFDGIKKFYTKNNPYWNFKWMKSLENKIGLASTWFFLPKGLKNVDAFYSFSEDRIKDLVSYLKDKGDCIGLHASYKSYDNMEIMKKDLDNVSTLINEAVIISRQHWLRFKYPDTLRILENLGIKYDCSWGFSDYYGWRNSYCLPFHPYDVEEDRMMDIWEVPLNAMDVTFFDYLNLSFDETQNAIDKMADRCREYGGLFTLLWHNSNLDEDEMPGIKKFYQQILNLFKGNEIVNFNPKFWTGFPKSFQN